MAGLPKAHLLDPVEDDPLTVRFMQCGVSWPLASTLSPWMRAIDRVEPGMTPWLREATRLAGLALRDWIEPTAAAEAALLRALAASEALAMTINGPLGRCAVDERRMAARAAMYGLVAASREAVPSRWAAVHNLGW